MSSESIVLNNSSQAVTGIVAGVCVLPCVGHVISKLDATMIDGCDIAQ